MTNPLLELSPEQNPFDVLGAHEDDSNSEIDGFVDGLNQKLADGLHGTGDIDVDRATIAKAARLLQDELFVRLYFAACWFGSDSEIGDKNDDADRN